MGAKGRAVKFYSTVSDRSEVVHLIARLFNIDGGEGSGNHGHAGRPGQVGGSAPGEGGSGVSSKPAKGSGTTNSSPVLTASKIKAQKKKTRTKETEKEYESRLKESQAEYEAQPSQHKISEGKNLSSSVLDYNGELRYESEADKSLFHKYVLKKQGFDGPPKVVSNDEFNAILKNNPGTSALLRSYGALSPEGADAMDESLNESKGSSGSGGGKKYGRGLYVAKGDGKRKEDTGDGFGVQAIVRQMYSNGSQYGGENEKVECADCDGRLQYWVFPKNPDFKSFKEEFPEDGQKILYRVNGFFGAYNQIGVIRNGKLYNTAMHSYGVEGKEKEEKLDGQIAGWCPATKTITPDFEPVTSAREMVLDPSAKVIKIHDFNKMLSVKIKDDNRPKGYRIEDVEDYGTIAALLGYDAIDCGNYISILNKTKIIINKDAVHKRVDPHIAKTKQ